MPEHEQSPQGSIQINDGAFAVPEASQADERSALRSNIIDPGIAEGQLIHQAAQGAVHREQELLNAIQADIGYNGELEEQPLPEVVDRGYAPLLGRVVQNDHDVELQRSMIEAMKHARENAQRARMDADDRDHALAKAAELHAILDPEGTNAARKASRQAAIEADEAKRRMPPPEIPRSA